VGGEPSVGTGVVSIAHTLDDAGDVVGWSSAPGGSRAALWQGGAVLPLGTALSGRDSVATGIDDLGLVVGSALVQGERHTVAWRDGIDIDLGTLGGAESAALAVAGSGTVVGRSTTSAGQTRATVWTLGGTVGSRAR
jgi:probable HAF family extracellular repeat protein